MSTLNWKDQAGITHSVNLKTPAELASAFSRYSVAKTLWVRNSSSDVGVPIFEHYINPSWTGEAYDDGHKYSIKVSDTSKILRLKNPDLKVNYLYSGLRTGGDYPDITTLTYSKNWKAEDALFANYDCNFFVETYKYAGPSTDVGNLVIKVDGIAVVSALRIASASYCLTLSGSHTIDVSIGVTGTNGDNKWWYNIMSTET